MKKVRGREIALLQSEAVRAAGGGLAGTRGLLLRWRAWAGREGAARRMAQRLAEAGVRRYVFFFFFILVLTHHELLFFLPFFSPWHVSKRRLSLASVRRGVTKLENQNRKEKNKTNYDKYKIVYVRYWISSYKWCCHACTVCVRTEKRNLKKRRSFDFIAEL